MLDLRKMMKTIDARDIPCPKPLILTRQALASLAVNEKLEVLINDKEAYANITDFLKDTGLEFTVNGFNFIITKNKELNQKADTSHKSSENKIVIVVVDKNYMGSDNKDLGSLLLKAFLDSIKYSNPKPETVYFYNEGVLLIEDKAYKKLLEELRECSISLKFCGACLKFFEITELVPLHEHTNILSIIEAQANAHFIIRI